MHENVKMLNMQGFLWKTFIFGFILNEIYLLTTASASIIGAGGFLDFSNLSYIRSYSPEWTLLPIAVLFLQ